MDNKQNFPFWDDNVFSPARKVTAPDGSLDKTVDDILAELYAEKRIAQPTQPAQPRPQAATTPRPAQPTQPAQPRPQAATPSAFAPVKPAVQPPIPTTIPLKPSEAAPSASTQKSAPKKTPKKDKWIWRFLGNFLPKKGDGFWESLRKAVCLCAIFVLVGSCCVLVNDFVLTPLGGNRLADTIDNVRKTPVSQDDDEKLYPAGILTSFKNLYKKNPDTIGWITYKSTSPYWNKKLADPGYVVVQANDNDFYLHRDFEKNDDRNGTIYMDYRCDYSTKETAENARITILYGHNMYSGLMFANVNKLLDGLSYAQSAPTVQFSSLFSEDTYKVFAVISNDATEAGAKNFLRTDFDGDRDFLEYIAELRLRSWYNYNDVNVRADDQLLVLYTCSNTYQTTMGKEGRTILVARKVRAGESADVDVSSITENENKLMPRQWYTNNDLALPAYYTSQDAADEAVQNAMNGN